MAAAKTGAETMSKAFVETEAFFKSHGKADGVEWAPSGQEGRRRHRRRRSADAAKAPAGELGKLCATCHAAYRERAADGSYNYKAGA